MAYIKEVYPCGYTIEISSWRLEIHPDNVGCPIHGHNCSPKIDKQKKG